MRRVSAAVFVILGCLLRTNSSAAELIGTPIDDFALQDYRGQKHTLSSLGDKKLVVVAFLGTECPLAKQYGPRLAELEQRYRERSVAFLGVNANVQDSITEISAYARTHKIEFPILKDAGNRLADRFQAVRTPEVFVLDEQRVVRYHGRIDDQYGVGFTRQTPQRNDLAIALDELLAEKPVSTAKTQAVGCHIGRIRQPKADATVTYAKHIAPLLQEHCVQCHRSGDIAPFAMTEYDEVVGWAEMIAEVVRENRMPPWHADERHGTFKNARRLRPDERQLIANWVAGGAPLGDRSDLPPPREFTSGWQLPKVPDLVIPVHQKPYRVPAQGEVRYQYFTVDPGFAEDKWISAAELQPGNRAVVHHILAFARPAGSRGRGGEDGVSGYLVGYVPGLRADPFPDKMAKRIPAGSELLFQVHYTPIGSEQFDESRLGLVFADRQAITHEIRTTSAANAGIRIPPHADNHRETAVNRRPLDDSLLLSMMPHMHLRGKSFLYEAQYPDGRTEVLLNVPHYDFNWQTAYHLAEPKRIPAGTVIHCVAHYDNSTDNLNNPDPTKQVRWGDQTWEEMLIGYFNVAVPLDRESNDNAKLTANLPPAVRARQLMQRYDANGDGKILRGEVPELLRRIFDRLDSDNNGELTESELAKSLERIRE